MNSQKLLAEICNHRPHLAQLLHHYGNYTLSDYTKNLLNYAPHPDFVARRRKYLTFLKSSLIPLYGIEASEKVCSQLDMHPVVQATGHEGIASYPIVFNANILFSMGLRGRRDMWIPSFCSGTVSGKNPSFPIGLLVCDYRDNGRRYVEIPLYSHRYGKHRFVGCYKYFENAHSIKSIIHKCLKPAFFKESGKDIDVFCQIVEQTKGLAENFLHRYSVQAGYVNSHMWPHLFQNVSFPCLLEAPSPALVPVEWLGDQVRKSSDNPVARLIWDAEWRQPFQKICHTGLYDGTFLFWGIRKNGKYSSLAVRNNSLEGRDFSLPLRAETIAMALENRRLLPSSMLELISCLYFGLKTCGGFMMVDGMTNIKKVWIQFLRQMEEVDEADLMETVPTDNFCGGPLLVYKRYGNICTPADIFDLTASPITEQQLETVGNCRLIDALMPAIPEIHEIICGGRFPQKAMTMEQIPEHAIVIDHTP